MGEPTGAQAENAIRDAGSVVDDVESWLTRQSG